MRYIYICIIQYLYHFESFDPKLHPECWTTLAPIGCKQPISLFSSMIESNLIRKQNLWEIKSISFTQIFFVNSNSAQVINSIKCLLFGLYKGLLKLPIEYIFLPFCLHVFTGWIVTSELVLVLRVNPFCVNLLPAKFLLINVEFCKRTSVANNRRNNKGTNTCEHRSELRSCTRRIWT